MDKFGHLFLLCGLIILPSLALSTITRTTSNSTKGNDTESKTFNASSNNLAQNTTGNITTSNYSVNNSTSPTIHHSTNVTNSDTMQSAVPSPTAQTTSTTVQIITLVTEKNTRTQSASESTVTALSTASMLSSPITTEHVSNESTSNTTPAYLTTIPTLDNKRNNETTAGPGLNNSEKSMTILFSMVLGVIVVIILVQFLYKFSKNKQRSVQYSHHPLYDDAGDQTGGPDDTLVISGGLYDGPQIYNSTVTALNDEDQPTFSYTPTQFHLEFLHDDQRADHK